MNPITGQSLYLQGTFRDGAGALFDPTTVVCTVKRPDLSRFQPAVTRISSGLYQATVDLDYAGSWKFQYASTAPGEKNSAWMAFTVDSDGF